MVEVMVSNYIWVVLLRNSIDLIMFLELKDLKEQKAVNSDRAPNITLLLLYNKPHKCNTTSRLLILGCDF